MKLFFSVLLGISSLFLYGVLPRMVVSLKVDKIFKKKLNWFYLFLLIILTIPYVSLESVAVILFYFFDFFYRTGKKIREYLYFMRCIYF